MNKIQQQQTAPLQNPENSPEDFADFLSRREQGFILYVNGANAKLNLGRPNPYNPDHHHHHFGRPNSDHHHNYACINQSKSPIRAKSAQAGPRRKQWELMSIEIKTHQGEKVKYRPPAFLSGRYDDDFHDDDEDDDDDDVIKEDIIIYEDDDDDEDDPTVNEKSLKNKADNNDDDEEEDDDGSLSDDTSRDILAFELGYISTEPNKSSNH
ncbi:hypothetical protein HELRODRAFT_178335 [Helobdella robusta]|uniref:Uncharacterized protein n=1 Tax=Helobdella robusta TaxID=6412 RepID=T1FD31_HELRO|nr:hypothetical protein HELRODRAFT_178335 [Helobdella robusta]ESN97213.1 hypothetical protein HELRODRAFT_178335 [Helobdella robusta]